MKRTALLFALFAAAPLACKSEPAQKAAPAEKAKAPVAAPPAHASSQPKEEGKDGSTSAQADEWQDGKVKRGAEFTLDSETALADILGAPQKFTGKTVKVRGSVQKNCTNKGCWMELTAEGLANAVRVKFKDYAFFVPLDSEGAKALVEGEVSVSELDKETAEHLASEGAKISKNADGEAVEIGLMASAVELSR